MKPIVSMMCIVAVAPILLATAALNPGNAADHHDCTIGGDSGQLLNYTLTAGSGMEKDSQSMYQLWYTNPLSKVFPDSLPNPAGIGTENNKLDEVRLCGARYEAVMFQLVLTRESHSHDAPSPVINVSFTPAEPSTGSVAVSLKQVRWTNITYPVNDDHKVGLFPDPLVGLPSEGAIVTLIGESDAFWLTVTVKDDTTTGDTVVGYISISIIGESSSSVLEIPVRMHVWNFTLPKEPKDYSQDTDAGYHGSSRSFGGKPTLSELSLTNWSTVPPMYYENFYEHGVNRQVWWDIDLGYTGPVLYGWKDGLPEGINTERFDVMAEKMINIGFSAFRFPAFYNSSAFLKGCHHSCEKTASYIFVVCDENVSNPLDTKCRELEYLIANQTSSTSDHVELNQTFVDMYTHTHHMLIEHLDSRGWMELFAWTSIIDEPTFNNDFTTALIIQVGRVYKSIDSRIKLSQTRWPIVPMNETLKRDYIELVDQWIASIAQIGPEPRCLVEMSRLRKRNGTLLHIYDNWIPIIDLPFHRVRTFPWQVWRTNFKGAYPELDGYGLQGSLSWYSVTAWSISPGVQSPWVCGNQYHYSAAHPKPYHSDAGGWGWPIYPPRSGNFFDPPSSSIRWEVWRKGLQDSEYFYTLNKMLPSCNATCLSTGNQKCCDAVVRANEALVGTSAVVWGFAEQFTGPTVPYGDNSTLLEDVLGTAGWTLEQLQKHCE